jgi:drug/metabolite transporter (DMT)-like permease
MALALLIPVIAALAILAIRMGWLPPRVWAAVVLLQALLVGFGWLSVETGEGQEERVEKVIGHDLIHDHEEAAETFLIVAAIGLVVMAAGLLPERKGNLGRIAGIVVSIAVLALGANTGRLRRKNAPPLDHSFSA